MRVTWSEIEEKVKVLLIENLHIEDKTERPLEVRFSNSYPIRDWISALRIMEELEEEYKVVVPDDQINQINSGLDVLDYLTQAIAKTTTIDVDSRTLAFKINENGKLQVGLQTTDGTWVYADGTSLLPAGIYLTTFSKWDNVLKELEEMINSPALAEQNLQDFFEEYPELLKCDEYDLIIPQARIVTEVDIAWRADFVLHPIDQTGFCKILELKLPQVSLVRPPRRAHPQIYSNLVLAINQLRDYGEAFHSTITREKFREAYKIDVFKPDLQLLVGRRWDILHMKNMLEFQRRNDLRIDDWDTYLEKLKRRFT